MYNNMVEDRTWKRKIGENDQINAPSTKVAELQAKPKNQVKQVVALTTQAKQEIAPDLANEGSTHCSKEIHTPLQLGN
jgi:hypothetical protein